MKVSCFINNNNPTFYNEAAIKELYQVVFIEDNFNEIHIYSGVIFGEIKDSPGSFGINIQYELEDDDKFLDEILITDITKEFNKESKGWQAVWGKDSKIIGTVPDLEYEYCRIYELEIDGPENLFLKNWINSNFNNNTFIKISGKTKPDIYNGIVFGVEIDKRVDNKIYIPLQMLTFPKKIDLINWHKTVIKLNEDGCKQFLTTREIEYHIGSIKESQSEFEFQAITFYIILPKNHELSSQGSTLEIHKQNKEPEISIPNHLQEIYTKDRKNYFDEWYTDYHITQRTYYTLSKNRQLKTDESFLLFKFKIINNVSSLFTQLIWTSVATLILAFGLDCTRLTRLEDYFLFFPEAAYMSVFIPLIAAIAPKLVNHILQRERIDFKKNLLIFWGLIITSFWFLLVFGFGGFNSYYPNILRTFIESHTSFISPSLTFICKITFVIAFISNFIALIFPKGKELWERMKILDKLKNWVNSKK